METLGHDQRLVSLRIEHRDLDAVINELADNLEADDVRMRRMKKRKLALKDEIAKLESDQLPNLIA
ncbi:MAG: YdcH family protein [Proteobacteria bacterium]|nr:YdcH family protein [Pseudomonadota bacterium]MDA1356320.1 YdcH family protein [Pseudomonadota bacterium]